MDKYIVEIDGKNICSDADGKDKLALSVKADNGYAVFCTEIPLTPYTEPDLEQVRKEAYEQGRKDGKIEGQTETWECARKIGCESMYGLEKIGFDFSQCVVDDYNPSWFVVKNYSASEAIEKIRQYEQEKEEQEEEKSITTEDVMRQYLDAFCHGRNCETCPLNTPNFTCGSGRHFLTSHPVSDALQDRETPSQRTLSGRRQSDRRYRDDMRLRVRRHGSDRSVSAYRDFIGEPAEGGGEHCEDVC